MNILVGVTGSSGVVELPMYLRVFREKLDANIRLVCTSNVQKFIDVNFWRRTLMLLHIRICTIFQRSIHEIEFLIPFT
ncbi:Flavoprotein [Anoxybacillus sp. BCO1]|nr:Flavoprotein [Anoxybacillus sp. BCO1]